MSLSLREQLLKAGLVTEQQAKQAERSSKDQRHRQAKGGQRKAPAPSPSTSAQQAQAAKLLRDQELNRKQREKAERKARAAQLRQLVEQLRVPRPESDEYYNFVDGGRIRRIQVTPELRARVVAGSLVIVRYSDRYDLVPAEAVERIREHDPDAVVAHATADGNAAPAEDDPYKDFVVPDDLTW
jgi:uncharacterized protein YaiL (DUF2058 family)